MMNESYTLRFAQQEDKAAIVELINASSLIVTGTHQATLQRFWLGENAVVVIDAADTVIAYAQLFSEEPHVVFKWRACVHPDYHRQGIGKQLIQWAEAKAKKLSSQAPKDARIVLQTEIFEQNQAACNLLQTNGFNQVRHWAHLKIILDHKPPEPILPEGIGIYDVREEDGDSIGAELELAFADHWGEIAPNPAPSAKLTLPLSETGSFDYGSPLFNTPGLCFMAVEDDEVVASCLCNQTTIEWSEGGRLGSLSVRPQWRKRGIGLALIHHAFRAFWERGIRQITTDTDADSFANAPSLYQRAGMEIFRYQYVYEKEIRAGHELRLMTAKKEYNHD